MRIPCRLPSLEERKGVLTRNLVVRVHEGAKGARVAQLADTEAGDVTEQLWRAEGELCRLPGFGEGEVGRGASRRVGLSQGDIAER